MSQGSAPKKYLLENTYGTDLYDTVSEALRDGRVLSITQVGDKWVLKEECDRYFSMTLTKEQMIAWIHELEELI